MPIYEYQCSCCKNVFELLQKMDEDCKVVCSKCMASIYFIQIEV